MQEISPTDSQQTEYLYFNEDDPTSMPYVDVIRMRMVEELGFVDEAVFDTNVEFLC